MEPDNENLPNIDDDSITDLGNDVPEDTEVTEADAPKRDDKGRFIKEGEKKEEPKKDEEPKKEEEEPEEEEEEDEEEEEEEEETATKGKKTIPFSRFQKAIADKNRLQAELDAAKAAAKVEERTDSKVQEQIKAFNDRLSELYGKVEDARVDGDSKLAASLQRQIDQMNQSVSRAEAQNAARVAAFQSQQNTTYNNLLDQLEAAQDVMRPGNDDFDPEVVRDMEDMTQAFVAKGYTQVDALNRAAKLMFGSSPFVKTVEAKGEEKKVEKKPEGRKTDIAKNAAAAKQPPAIGSRVGEDNTKLDVLSMTDEEFDKLPDSTKRQLRGDDV